MMRRGELGEVASAAAQDGRHRNVVLATDVSTEQMADDVPGGQGNQKTEDQNESYVSSEQAGRRDGSRVRRHEDVHDRESHGRRKRIAEERSAEATGDGEDDRQHDDKAGVEKDRKTEHERRNGEGDRRAPFSKPGDQGIRQHLRSTAGFQHAAEHGTQADEQGDPGQGAAEAFEQGGHEADGRNAGGDRGQQTYDDQRQERVHLELHDEHEEHRDRAGGNAEQSGGAEHPVHFKIGHQ
jgi:hypothetical protein